MSERAPRTYQLEEALPASTILATTTVQLGEAKEAGVLQGAVLISNANITGAASPASRRWDIINKGLDGNGAVVMASLEALGGVNPLDFDEMAFTLSAVANALNVVAGDILVCTSAPVGGTGLVDPGGRVRCEIARS